MVTLIITNQTFQKQFATIAHGEEDAYENHKANQFGLSEEQFTNIFTYLGKK